MSMCTIEIHSIQGSPTEVVFQSTGPLLGIEIYLLLYFHLYNGTKVVQKLALTIPNYSSILVTFV